MQTSSKSVTPSKTHVLPATPATLATSGAWWSEAWGKQSPTPHCHCERSEAISQQARGWLRRCAPRNDSGSDIASKAWGICPLPSAVRCLRSTVGNCFAAGACRFWLPLLEFVPSNMKAELRSSRVGRLFCENCSTWPPALFKRINNQQYSFTHQFLMLCVLCALCGEFLQ